MKSPNSSDSLGEDQNQGNSHMYGREYQAIYDEDGCLDECGPKKRRLSIDQVKALEKNFEVENKLEPDRKVKLAHDLGLQPRQVAVWFQNRRARWKTKQLERDYGVLKANFDALKCNYESVQNENDALAKEIQELKSKFKDDKSESTVSVKRELIVSETITWLLNRVVAKLIQELKSKLKDDKSESTVSVKTELIVSETNNLVIEQTSFKPQSVSSPSISDQPQTDLDYDVYNNNHASIFKDGSGSGASDSSESSAILNDESSAAISSSSLLNLLSNPATNSYQFSETKIILGDAQKAYQPQFVKIEEHNFFCGDEACNFFSEDQAPTLQWFSSDQWS